MIFIGFIIGTLVGGGFMGFIAAANIQEDRFDDYDTGYAQGRKDERSLHTS